MRRRCVAVLLVATTMLVVPSVAGAARSGVTIHHKNRFQFYGYVFSPDPNRCARFRSVRLFKQVGKEQNRRRDIKVSANAANDKAGSNRYKWHANERDFTHGRFYALVGKIPGCKRDSSRTIRVR